MKESLGRSPVRYSRRNLLASEQFGERLADCAEVWEAVAKAEVDLGHEGRVLLRPSGTEPLVRVMVEARVEAQADAVAAQLAGVVEAALRQIEPQAPR